MPFLMLGPFKLEYHHHNPEIGQIHEFVSASQANDILELVRGKTSSTPYFVMGSEKNYSQERTSKIRYVNETLTPEAMDISRNIEYATRFKLFNRLFASENFQIMNYGVGGKINPHVDTFGQIYNTFDAKLNELQETMMRQASEKISSGGLRIMTFMTYLSSVEVGEHTVFPQPGISIKPEVGSAVYWFNVGAQNNYDSRTRHLGCPVLYGNKWIANKWIKWLANYDSYPCLVKNKHYSINII